MQTFWDPVSGPTSGVRSDPWLRSLQDEVRGGTRCWNAREATKGVLVTPMVVTAATAVGRPHAHHIFPRGRGGRLAAEFSRRGISEVERRALTRLVPAGKHIFKPFGIHTTLGGNWNAVWKAYLAAYPDHRRYQLLRQAVRMMRDFGI
jgi:hypothetical protein